MKGSCVENVDSEVKLRKDFVKAVIIEREERWPLYTQYMSDEVESRGLSSSWFEAVFASTANQEWENITFEVNRCE